MGCQMISVIAMNKHTIILFANVHFLFIFYLHFLLSNQQICLQKLQIFYDFILVVVKSKQDFKLRDNEDVKNHLSNRHLRIPD